MFSSPLRLIAAAALAIALTPLAMAATPMREVVDREIARGEAALAPAASDAEFLRRAYLDLSGSIPTSDEARAFLADKDPQKRGKLIDRLLASPAYPRRMREAVGNMLLERRSSKTVDENAWNAWLENAFATNKPWDVMVREMIAADGQDDATAAGMKFFLDRGEPVDQTLIVRDVSRLMLGMDLACAQCHDHPSVKEWKQVDYQGLFAYLHRSYVYREPKTKKVFWAEKGDGGKIEYESVFIADKKFATGPRLPGMGELDVPTFAKGQDLASKAADGKPPIAKYRPRLLLAENLTTADNRQFARNAANRLWFLVMGRGLVHPLDMDHAENPPSHPKLLDALTDELVRMKFDVKGFVRELMLSETYARASVMPDGAPVPPAQSFRAANLKRMSAEQLMWSVLAATGETQRVLEAKPTAAPAKGDSDANADAEAPAAAKDGPLTLETVRGKFVAAFANPPGEAEESFAPTAAGALFLANDKMILGFLQPRPGNLVARLSALDAPRAAADELYLSILTRFPSDEEYADVAAYLALRGVEHRVAALGELAWSLIASTEFCVNH